MMVKRSREPLDAVVGLVVGATLGLGACLFVVTQTPYFPRSPFWFAAVVCGLGAVVCGVLGYYKGDDFFRSLRDDWFG
jgi:hypothetical protein